MWSAELGVHRDAGGGWRGEVGVRNEERREGMRSKTSGRRRGGGNFKGVVRGSMAHSIRT